ncbi:MAG TPA: tetratricopeptide repeat protein [Terracidiphilus sp.]|nr:tetratricopeptide repeat protein [Terracidiphilus sp.]
MTHCALALALGTFAASAGCVTAQEASPQFSDLAAQAAAARDQQDLPLAIRLYAQAVQQKPDWAEGWWYLGLLQYSTNQFAPAIDAFNHLIQLQPKAAPAVALRGLCEFETGAYEDSLRDLQLAVDHGAANDPQNAQILRYHLAQLLTRSSQFQDALNAYKYFATNHIQDADLLVGIGLAGMRVPALTKEIPAQKRALYQEAGTAGYAFLGDESHQADALFRELFARYPSTPGLHFFYGFLLFAHAPDLAVEQFQSEVALAPENVQARAMLAFTLMVDGKFQKALPQAEHAYAAAPDMELAQLALGRSLAETGETQRAMTLLQQVLKQDPNNLEAHLGLVAIYSHEGKREDAYRERLLCLGLGGK